MKNPRISLTALFSVISLVMIAVICLVIILPAYQTAQEVGDEMLSTMRNSAVESFNKNIELDYRTRQIEQLQSDVEAMQHAWPDLVMIEVIDADSQVLAKIDSESDGLAIINKPITAGLSTDTKRIIGSVHTAWSNKVINDVVSRQTNRAFRLATVGLIAVVLLLAVAYRAIINSSTGLVESMQRIAKGQRPRPLRHFGIIELRKINTGMKRMWLAIRRRENRIIRMKEAHQVVLVKLAEVIKAYIVDARYAITAVTSDDPLFSRYAAQHFDQYSDRMERIADLAQQFAKNVHTATVLFIGDESEHSRKISRILEPHGVTWMHVENDRAALPLFERGSVDLVILDTADNDSRIASQLRRCENATRQQPAIIVSTTDDAIGVDAHLQQLDAMEVAASVRAAKAARSTHQG